MDNSLALHYVQPLEHNGKLYVEPNPSLIAQEISKWERCLVGYFVGASMPFNVVKRIAMRLWERHGLQEVFALKGLFYFRCAFVGDAHTIFAKGP